MIAVSGRFPVSKLFIRRSAAVIFLMKWVGDASNHVGLNRIESSKDPTAEPSQLSTQQSLMNSSYPESSSDTESELDSTEAASPKLLWTNQSNTSWKTESVLLELPTEN